MRGDENGSASSRTLAEVLRDGTPTVGDAVRIAAAVAEQVAALHAGGRAHGGVGPRTVVLQDDEVTLAGPFAPKTGLAAPAAVRDADLAGTGRVLAAALGWGDGPIPGPIERIVVRAREADAPASVLALALRRLQQDPLTVAALLPPPAEPTAAEPGLRGLLGLLIPNSDRRTTGVAAAVLGGVAALGAVLLLAGTPGSTVAPPRAVEAAAVAPAPEPSSAALAAAPAPTSLPALLHPVKQHAPAAAIAPTRRQEVAAVEVAGPTVAPSPTAATPTPTGSATPTAEPTTVTTQPPAEAPPASSAPTAAPSAAPSAPPTAAPSAPPGTTAPSSAPAAPASTAPAPSSAVTG